MNPSRRSTGPMSITAIVVALLLTLSGVSVAAAGSTGRAPQGRSGPPSTAALVALLRQKIKYVFVLYQENRSFDSLFGTYPGAEGLYADQNGPHANPLNLPGFVQPLVTATGAVSTISPFLIGPSVYAADTDDINHSHAVLVQKMDFTRGAAQMDRFALTEEAIHSPGGMLPAPGQPVSLQAKQYGELAMAYEDCNTVPLLWRWAHNFTLADHMFQDMTGP